MEFYQYQTLLHNVSLLTHVRNCFSLMLDPSSQSQAAWCYARYDNIDYIDECDILCQAMRSSPITLFESGVVGCFSRNNPNKAPGSDCLRGRVMNGSAWSFSTRFFQIALKHTFYATLVKPIYYYAHCQQSWRQKIF